MTQNTIQIYRPSGNYAYLVRVPKFIICGHCLFWSMKFEGTRDECVRFCQDKYQIPWWQWSWNADKIIYGQS